MAFAYSKALITGASSGLGRAIAARLGGFAPHLVLVARREERLRELAAEVEAAGATAQVEPADLIEPVQLERLCALVRDSDPPVDILINCAGIRVSAPFVMTDPEMWEAHLRLNLLAPMHLGRAFGLTLRRARKPGCLLNIASVAALVGAPGASVYCATKGALVAWGRALAAEWAKSGIRVVSICPGFVESEMLDEMRSKVPAPVFDQIEAAHPLGFGKPEDIAELVAAILGPAGRWMTGNALVIDGGYSAL